MYPMVDDNCISLFLAKLLVLEHFPDTVAEIKVPLYIRSLYMYVIFLVKQTQVLRRHKSKFRLFKQLWELRCILNTYKLTCRLRGTGRFLHGRRIKVSVNLR